MESMFSLNRYRIALWMSIMTGFCYGVISCKEKSPNKIGALEAKEQNYHIDLKTDSESNESEKLVKVEAFGKKGEKYKGEIVFRGENAAGYIYVNSEEKIFVDVKESIDGGFEAIDINGNKYFLLLMR
ncbi:hypothetical protein [Myroides sp. LoEW2-1]|uniref:hypothetical protein n=1 Tax=Myroides sp. LoEW2-1 TaxID=2683192 RepID=UPI001365717C|nr:hypothetical protein [Myroides sp. LoEW2-1]